MLRGGGQVELQWKRLGRNMAGDGRGAILTRTGRLMRWRTEVAGLHGLRHGPPAELRAAGGDL